LFLDFQKTQEGHTAPKLTTLQKYTATFTNLLAAPGIIDLIHQLNQMMPEGQDFVSLDNLNSKAFWSMTPEDMRAVLHHYKLYYNKAPVKKHFWGLITTHWHNLQQQMDTFHAAKNAAKMAKCCFKDEQELQSIWKHICLGEYISPDGEHVKIQPPSMLTMEVTNTFKNHPYHSKFINDQALKTSLEALQQELAAVKAASKAKEQGMHTCSSSTTEQQRRLLALAKVSQHCLHLWLVKHKADAELQKKYSP
ncbi:uncharacterized protein ACA1_180950, partial [Acanthamoeba castellanii str. Neff]